MKRLLTAFGLFAFLCFAKKAEAVQPVGVVGPYTTYSITHSTGISITSSTIATIPAAPGYRTVDIQFLPTNLQDGVTVYMRLDGFTTGISSYGYIVRLTTATGAMAGNAVNTFTFEQNQRISLQMAPSQSGTVSAKYTEKRLNY